MKFTKKKILIIIIGFLFLLFLENTVCGAYIKLSNRLELVSESLDLKDSIKRSTYNKLLANNNSLEERYNLKEELFNKGINLLVKNQYNSKACWAFGFTSTLESSLGVQKGNISNIYSPMHLNYKAAKMYYNRNLSDGGANLMSVAYASDGYGPVLENDMKFEDYYDSTEDKYKVTKEEVNDEDLEKDVYARLKDTVEFAKIYKMEEDEELYYYSDSSCEDEYIIEDDTNEVEGIRNIIKKHIKQYGGVSAEIKFTGYTTYFDDNNYSYNYDNYDYSSTYTDHDVTIVGWDDNYSKDKFKEGHKPSTNGAYIVLNSYGTNWGDEGYFYISYEDAFIETGLMGITNILQYNNGKKDYDKIYQYDELGINAGFPVEGNIVYGANVFTRDNKENEDEYLKEIGLHILKTSGVEIYINSSDGDVEKATTLVASKTGTEALEAGYHVVELSSPQKLTGDKFVIKVKYINNDQDSNVVVPMEINFTEFGYTFGDSSLYDTAKANDGEGFISQDGEQWQDVNKTTVQMSDGDHSLKNSSLCIKGFTTIQESIQNENVEVSEIKLSESNIELIEGETKNLVVTIDPSNATNKNVSWTSSNTEVAIVSEDGTVTAKKEGTVTITAKTEDGGKIASCTVTVKANKTTEDETTEEDIKVESIKVNITSTQVTVEDKMKLEVTIEPSNATNKKVIWTSSDPEIATVSEDGTITAKKEGTVTITARTEDGGKVASCIIKINPKQADNEKDEENIENKENEEKNENIEDIKVTKVYLNKNELEIQKGEIFNLVATIEPSNAKNKKVKWSSSNEKVLTVSETGIITAVGEGTAIITVTTEDGNKEDKCEITVTKKEETADDIYKDTDKEEANEDIDIDKTTAEGNLPFTGVGIIGFSVIILTVIAIILFIKLKSFKDVK